MFNYDPNVFPLPRDDREKVGKARKKQEEVENR
jgi:hypothetical protein